MALKLDPDRNGSSAEFEQITKAYNYSNPDPHPQNQLKNTNA